MQQGTKVRPTGMRWLLGMKIDGSHDELASRLQNKKKMSWYDKLTSWWGERSFLVKSATIVGITISFGFVGSFAGAVLWFALPAAVFSMMVNTVFVLDDKSRRKKEKVRLAKEKLVLDETTTESDAVVDEPHELSVVIEEVTLGQEEGSKKASFFGVEIESALVLEGHEEPESVREVKTPTIRTAALKKTTEVAVSSVLVESPIREQIIAETKVPEAPVDIPSAMVDLKPLVVSGDRAEPVILLDVETHEGRQITQEYPNSLEDVQVTLAPVLNTQEMVKVPTVKAPTEPVVSVVVALPISEDFIVNKAKHDESVEAHSIMQELNPIFDVGDSNAQVALLDIGVNPCGQALQESSAFITEELQVVPSPTVDQSELDAINIKLEEEASGSPHIIIKAVESLETVDLGVTIEKVEEVCEVARNQTAAVEVEVQRVHQATEVLVTIADEVKDVTSLMVTQEQAVATNFESVAVNLTAVRRAIEETTVQVQGIGEAAQQFSESVQEVQESSKGFTTAANRFSLFVDETIRSKPPRTDTDYAELDAEIDMLGVKIDAHKEYLARVQQLMARR